jgi:hypothetical protein
VAIERRSAINQQGIQMMWPLFGVNYDHTRTSRRNGDKIRVRHLIGLAACHVNFVGHKRYRVIEFANRFDDHEKRIILAYRVFKIFATRASDYDANLAVTSSKPAVFVI